MRRTALALISLISTLLLVVVASPFLRLASANPVPWPSTPIQDKPTLTIESPRNNTAYNYSDVYLSLTVTKPDTLYAIGGGTADSGILTINEQYTPIGYGTPSPTPSPNPSPNPSSFPIVPVVAVSVVVAVMIAAGLLVYFKKRHH